MEVIKTGLEAAAVVLLAVLAWAAFVYCSPYRECRWCAAFASIGMRCRRCKGTKLSPRAGARLVHKEVLALRQARDERSAP